MLVPFPLELMMMGVVRHTSYTPDPTLFIQAASCNSILSLFSVCADQRMRSITKQISGLQERQTFIYLHMKGIISVSWSQNYSKQHKNVNINSTTKQKIS